MAGITRKVKKIIKRDSDGNIVPNTVYSPYENEYELVLPQMYHSSGDHNSRLTVYISMPGRNNWSAFFLDRQYQQIAPYDGIVTKFIIRPANGDQDNDAIIQVRTNSDGYTIEDGQTGIVIEEFTLRCNNDMEAVEFVPPTPPTITKGHVFGFSIKKQVGDTYRNTNFVAVIDWDLNS